jgi:hypothetical protein
LSTELPTSFALDANLVLHMMSFVEEKKIGLHIWSKLNVSIRLIVFFFIYIKNPFLVVVADGFLWLPSVVPFI